MLIKLAAFWMLNQSGSFWNKLHLDVIYYIFNILFAEKNIGIMHYI